MGGRDQSERLVAINRNNWSRSFGARTFSEGSELATMSARNARISTSKEVARELWKMAQEYQAEAAKLGRMPDIGDPPQGLKG
jgi:hypothetical protein